MVTWHVSATRRGMEAERVDVGTDGCHCCRHHRVGGALQSGIEIGESTSNGTTNAQMQSLYGLDSSPPLTNRTVKRPPRAAC